MAESNILVTGFGPFGEHKVNASWEAVKLLPQNRFEGYKLILKQVPVIYKYVDEQVPEFWKIYNPKLVVHVGVSSLAKDIKIEKQAFKEGYAKRDFVNEFHPTGQVCKEGNDCLASQIDVEVVSKRAEEKMKYRVAASTDAGRYLCEFIYYKSLSIDTSRTLFIHVPPLGQPYTAEELAEALVVIIEEALGHLCDCTSK